MAQGRNENGEGWGKLLSFKDADQTPHHWLMPMKLLSGDTKEVLAQLRFLGLNIEPRMHHHLIDFLISANPSSRIQTVDRTGWHDCHFVLPDCQGTVISPDNVSSERLVLETGLRSELTSDAGSLEEWQTNLAALAVGNSRLLFAISMGFGAPLLTPLGIESGGVSFYGPSGCGKTTCLLAAASVAGSKINAWRATANGLESKAALHNDGLLCLDEIGTADPSEVADVQYQLANGIGKMRMNVDGTSRPVKRWNVLYVSTGEQSFIGLSQEAGVKTKVGQELRLAEIPADARAGMGSWEILHGQPNGAAFADAIKAACKLFHGTAGPAFVRYLVNHRDKLKSEYASFRENFLASAIPAKTHSQLGRVAERFALIAFAGELATKAGITGWKPGDAMAGVKSCCKAWLKAYPEATRQQEEIQAIDQIRMFIIAHGTSRFEDVELAGTGTRIINRAGWFRKSKNNPDEIEYLFPTASFREVCGSYNHEWLAKVLRARGYLVLAPGRRLSAPTRIKGVGMLRCYIVSSSILADAPTPDNAVSEVSRLLQ